MGAPCSHIVSGVDVDAGRATPPERRGPLPAGGRSALDQDNTLVRRTSLRADFADGPPRPRPRILAPRLLRRVRGSVAPAALPGIALPPGWWLRRRPTQEWTSFEGDGRKEEVHAVVIARKWGRPRTSWRSSSRNRSVLARRPAGLRAPQGRTGTRVARRVRISS